VALNAAAVLVVSSVSASGAATICWNNFSSPNFAYSAAADGVNVYALARANHVPGSGYRLKKRGWYDTSWTWESGNSSAGSGGTSLTMSYNGALWLAAEDNSVWRRVTQGQWSQVPTPACEGGAVQIRQVVGDNNLAVGADAQGYDQAYVISGTRLRWFNGACWWNMPALPSGSPTEVGIWIGDTAPHRLPWVTNASGTIYRWDGSKWVQITTGTAHGLGYSSGPSPVNSPIIGSDDTSVWWFQSSSGSFVRDNTWVWGKITELAWCSSARRSIHPILKTPAMASFGISTQPGWAVEAERASRGRSKPDSRDVSRFRWRGRRRPPPGPPRIQPTHNKNLHREITQKPK
jgi:hypothetical protein